MLVLVGGSEGRIPELPKVQKIVGAPRDQASFSQIKEQNINKSTMFLDTVHHVTDLLTHRMMALWTAHRIYSAAIEILVVVTGHNGRNAI